MSPPSLSNSPVSLAAKGLFFLCQLLNCKLDYSGSLNHVMTALAVTSLQVGSSYHLPGLPSQLVKLVRLFRSKEQ